MCRRLVMARGPHAPRCYQQRQPQAKMFVPTGDTFGGRSPERKAAEGLQRLFTFVAARIVLSQLEGTGRGALGSYNTQAFTDLSEHLHKRPLDDSEAWLAELCRRNEMLGVRVMEVRAAYVGEDFEWDQLQRLAKKGVQDSNVKLLRQQAEARFARQLAAEQDPEPSK